MTGIGTIRRITRHKRSKKEDTGKGNTRTTTGAKRSSKRSHDNGTSPMRIGKPPNNGMINRTRIGTHEGGASRNPRR